MFTHLQSARMRHFHFRWSGYNTSHTHDRLLEHIFNVVVPIRPATLHCSILSLAPCHFFLCWIFIHVLPYFDLVITKLKTKRKFIQFVLSGGCVIPCHPYYRVKMYLWVLFIPIIYAIREGTSSRMNIWDYVYAVKLCWFHHTTFQVMWRYPTYFQEMAHAITIVAGYYDSI